MKRSSWVYDPVATASGSVTKCVTNGQRRRAILD